MEGAFVGRRRNYAGATFDESDLAPTWHAQFTRWFAETTVPGGPAELAEPHAVVLATAAADGRPSARTVLLKAFDEHGFVFFTNYTSRKGRELTANPQATLLFPWHPIGRQVIVEGAVVALDPAANAAYIATRPAGAQLSAWASRQSSVLPGRAALEERRAALLARYGAVLPAPDFWGGFRVVPDAVEFWQGRADRLHDRLRYRLEPAGGWLVERLAP